MRLNRRSSRASASASRPDDTRVMPGLCRKLEIEELAQDPLAQLAVLGQDERVVEAADEQDVLDPVLREVLEPRQTGRGPAGASLGWMT